MTELRNLDKEIKRFHRRLVVAGTFVMLCFLLLGVRLYVLQVERHEVLSDQAESNRTAIVPIVPHRGLIMDRNGVVLASNYSAYTLEITPSKVADLDATIEALAQLVDITPRDRRRFKKLREELRNFESLPIRTRLTDVEVARFAAQAYRFAGVEIKARLFRTYPYGEVGSHVIGYIGRINPAEKERIADDDDEANYRGTEYIGKLGVEQSYEKELHGTTGVEEIETSASGRAVRRLDSTPATAGNNVALSLDIKLQKMVEDLYGNRRGALVAIEPRTGEVLAFVSKPTFDPNIFVEGIDVDNWRELNDSPDKPLLNRALRGTYPPGSTYKPFMALVALETGKRTPQSAIHDPGYFNWGNHRFNDDKPGGHGTVDMYKSIVQSCDTYYYQLASEMGVDLMHDQMKPLGFGQITGIDIEGESRGILPSTEWKRRAYRKPEQKRWYSGETISLGIGQGYNTFTMLQLAHATATLANQGLKMRPHLVREVIQIGTNEKRLIAKQPIGDLAYKPSNIAVIKRAMVGVNIEGTSASSFRSAGYVSAGKTGTAQVIGLKRGEKYDAKKLDERHRDHALYMAFAPADEPKIAVALIVENAGFGAESAAPIARRVFDYWLMGKYPSEDDIAAVRRGKATVPLGTPRTVADTPLPELAATSVKSAPMLATATTLITATGTVVITASPTAVATGASSSASARVIPPSTQASAAWSPAASHPGMAASAAVAGPQRPAPGPVTPSSAPVLAPSPTAPPAIKPEKARGDAP